MKSILLSLVAFTALTAQAHNYKRMIVFGDSLSDGGTYSPAVAAMGGGKFTVNPGTNWVDALSEQLQLPISLNRTEGFGQAPVLLGGLNYAQGGARIKQNPGVGFEKGYSARSLNDQLQMFLEENKKFDSSDLVLVEGGANDIFLQATKVLLGQATLAQALSEVEQATTDLADLVATVKKQGRPHTVVLTLADLGTTPKALQLGAKASQLFSLLTEKFNARVLKKIKGLGGKTQVHGWKIQIARIDLMDKQIRRHAERYGISNTTEQACPKTTLPGNSALLCKTDLLVSADAASTYKFSDDVHPTPKVYAIFADYVKGLVAPAPQSTLE